MNGWKKPCYGSARWGFLLIFFFLLSLWSIIPLLVCPDLGCKPSGLFLFLGMFNFFCERKVGHAPFCSNLSCRLHHCRCKDTRKSNSQMCFSALETKIRHVKNFQTNKQQLMHSSSLPAALRDDSKPNTSRDMITAHRSRFKKKRRKNIHTLKSRDYDSLALV